MLNQLSLLRSTNQPCQSAKNCRPGLNRLPRFDVWLTWTSSSHKQFSDLYSPLPPHQTPLSSNPIHPHLTPYLICTQTDGLGYAGTGSVMPMHSLIGLDFFYGRFDPVLSCPSTFSLHQSDASTTNTCAEM